MMEKLEKLLSIKSIVTIVLAGLFVYMSITGKVSGDQVLNIFTVIIAFYFGTQAEKERR